MLDPNTAAVEPGEADAAVDAAAAAAAGDRGAGTAHHPHVAVHGRTAAYALLGGMSLVWGVHWVIAKWALLAMGPFTFGLLRVATGLVTAVGIALARRQLRLPHRADLPIVLSVGLGQVAAGTLLMNVALQVMPAGRSAVLVYTMPLWVAVVHVLGFRIRPTRAEAVGMLLGLAGVAVLLNPGEIDWTAGGELAGAGLLLLSAAIWGVTTIHVRRHRWHASPATLQPWQLLVALVPFLLVAPLVEPGLPVDWSASTGAILAYSGPLATAFAMWASQSITRSLGPQAATTGFLAVPMVGLIAGAVLLSEPLTFVDLAGFGLIVLGVVATSRGPLDHPA